MPLRHTDFMQTIATRLAQHLAPPFNHPRFGETRWLCQVYYGEERRIHYEVSRPANRQGRQIEIGLHFESRDRALNAHLLTCLDRHLLEIQVALERDIKAEMWDKGWAKVYEIYPDQELTEALAEQMTRRLAQFITVVQPIYQAITER